MFNFFDTIISFIETIVSFVLHMFDMIVYLFEFIFGGVAYAISCVLFLPTWLQAFVFALIGYAVIMTILKKGG